MLSRRLATLEAATADSVYVDVPLRDFMAGQLPPAWSLLKAIRASYGYDPDGSDPIVEQRPVWRAGGRQ
jgi:hypothetical protein